jgi:probable F420-dependent oxidoreductase
MTSVFIGCSLLSDDEILTLAPHIERLGFDGLSVADHVFIPTEEPDTYPYKYAHTSRGAAPFALDTPWPDPLVLMGALAMVTDRSRLITSVFILPLRHPLLLAKAVAAAARISHGRVVLGIGVGWQRAEFDAVGVDFTKRGVIADEMITALRTLWQPGPVEHRGRFFSFGPLYSEPVPPHIPILVGGTSEAALRRAARLGDGNILPMMRVDEMSSHIASLRALLTEYGRDVSKFELIVRADSPTSEEVKRILDLGVDTIGITPWPWFPTTPRTHRERIDYLERCAETVLPLTFPK